MNRKKYKKIKHQAELIALEWLKTLVTSEEASKITLENHVKLMPSRSYYKKRRTTYITHYHPKWIRNQIKKLLRSDPELKLKDINLEKVQWNMNRYLS